MNRAHAQRPSALQIEFPVVDEHTFFRMALRDFEREPVDSFIGFTDAQIAGAEKGLKLTPQLERPDSVFVQFEPFV